MVTASANHPTLTTHKLLTHVTCIVISASVSFQRLCVFGLDGAIQMLLLLFATIIII